MNVQMSKSQRGFIEVATEVLRARRVREARKTFYRMFPDEDILGDDGAILVHAREKYAKHMEFFEAGDTYRERCFMAANRVGKTYGAGGYEIACHLTGEYPHWWKGRRFTRPIKAWAAGKTNETTRDIVQKTLVGEIKEGGRKFVDGTGVIPGVLLGGLTWKQGVSDLIDTIRVKHTPTGGWSTLGLKSYQQGRGSFEGTAQHVIWFDEEPPLDVYSEGMIRTATTDGLIMLTFTPLEGLSETVMQFLPQEMRLDA